jgi:hypothetical protein
MGFIDYSRIGAPSYYKEITGVGDALFEAMKMNAQKRQEDEKERHNKALEDYNQQIVKNNQAQNDRLVTVEENRNNREVNKAASGAIAQARKQFGSGDVTGAKATLAAAGVRDSELHSGQEPSLGPVPLEVGPEPQIPPAVAHQAISMLPGMPEAYRRTAAGENIQSAPTEDHAGKVFVDRMEGDPGSEKAVIMAGPDGEEVFDHPAAALPPGTKEGDWIDDPRRPSAPTEPPPVDPSSGAPIPVPPGAAAAPAKPTSEGPPPENEVQIQSGRYQTELRGYRSRQEAQKKYEEDQANLPAAQRAYRDATVHELTLPNGQKVKVGEGEARHEATVTAAQDMQDAIMPELQRQLSMARSLPDEQASAHAESEVNRQIGLFQQHLAAVASGAEKPADAMKGYRADVQDRQHEARVVSEGALNRVSAERRAATMASHQTTKEEQSDARLALSQDDAFRKRADDLNKEWNTPKDLLAYNGLSHAVQDASSTNALLQSGVKYNLARALQGVGPLTDRDLDRLRSQPGIGARLQSMAQQLEDATLGEAEQKTLIDASAKMLAQKDQDVKRGVKAYHQLYNESLPWINILGKGYLDAEGQARFGDLWVPPERSAEGSGDRLPGRSSVGTRHKTVRSTSTRTTGQPPSDNESKYKAIIDKLMSD